MTQYWAWAPKRKRPSRVQKKIDARGGALHYLPPGFRDSWFAEPPGPHSFHILTRRHHVARAPSEGAGFLWRRMMSSASVVRKTWVGDSEVSTVFLGLNHGFMGPPKWFETMVFGGPWDDRMWRHTTWWEALESHHVVVQGLKEALREGFDETLTELG